MEEQLREVFKLWKIRTLYSLYLYWYAVSRGLCACSDKSSYLLHIYSSHTKIKVCHAKKLSKYLDLDGDNHIPLHQVDFFVLSKYNFHISALRNNTRLKRILHQIIKFKEIHLMYFLFTQCQFQDGFSNHILK